MPNNDPMLAAIALLQVFNAMLVGGVAWYFAYHQKRIAEEQKRIAKEKLRLDLFDKRFAMFDATREFIGKALGRSLEDEDLNTFLVRTSGASFLLNDELTNYLDEIRRRVIDLPFLRDEISDAQRVGNLEEEKEAQVKYRDTRRWFREQTRVVEGKFKPLLQLDG
jgi:hypothetical protein